MQYAIVIKTLGLLILLLATTFAPSMVIALFYADSSPIPFVLSTLIATMVGLLLWLPLRRFKAELRIRDGFLLATLFWTVLGLISVLPFLFSEQLPHLSFAEMFFETISGLTTTGSSVLTNIENLPYALLYYRAQLQFIGGLGVIILAVAIFPMLGVGGMQLYRLEKPGPTEESKLTPRIKETARTLWYVYLLLNVACTLSYWAAGMTLFDAITHSFGTIATAGLSNYDASFGYFDSRLIESIGIIFMFLGSLNFSLHFLALRQKSLMPFWKDAEFRAHLGTYLLVSTLVVLGLFYFYSPSLNYALRHGLFNSMSLMTTTGFVSTDFSIWPSFMPLLLILSSFIGGSTGSTSGGLKVFRVLMLLKQGAREIKRLIHPYGYFSIKVGQQAASERVIEGIWGFFSAYVILFIIMLVLLVGNGVDQVTAFSALSACMNNMGPGLGAVSAYYGNLSDFSTWVLSMAMILGRLEIFTVLVLFTPYFWKK